MFLSYEVVTTFGVSALLSFFMSVTILLAVASKRGLLRPPAVTLPLVPPPLNEKPLPSAPELEPLALWLILCTCGYSIYRVYRLQQNGQVAILLRPIKVLFSHKKEGEPNEQLRTVVAYKNPFTGDYCVSKSREPRGYLNSMPMEPDSPDSGLSDDQYEPLNLVPPCPPPRDIQGLHGQDSSQCREQYKPAMSPVYDNSLNKTRKWNYTEYQI